MRVESNRSPLGRHGRACAAAFALVLAAGDGWGRDKEVVIEFPSPDRCVLLGQEIGANELAARLASMQDGSPAFDTMDFRVVVGPAVAEDAVQAIGREVQDILRGLGAGNKLTVEHRATLLVRMLTSFWLWVLIVVAVAAAFLMRKKREADNAWRKGPAAG